MPVWGDAKDAKGREAIAKVNEMEAITKQKERDRLKEEELAESQRQPNVRSRLHKRYGIGDGTTTKELVEQFTGGAVEPEPEPEQASGGVGRALVLSSGDRDHLRSHVSLPKAEQRAKTKAEVEKLRLRLEAIDRRNTMTLEQYLPPEKLVEAKKNLVQMRANTTGYLARKAAEYKDKKEQDEAARKEREKSADILTAASVGDDVQLRLLLKDELKIFYDDCVQDGKTGQAAQEQRASFKSELIKQADEEGRTPLHYAACFGFLDVTKTLCSSGANPSQEDPAGYSPLHFACRWDQPAVAEYLLTLQHYTGPKEDWNVNINCTDKWGQTPLHVAALAGHADVVELLLNKKNKENCDIDAEDEDGNKAIDVARDAATLAQLNAVIHGRPSVRTLQMQEEARQAELDELSEELAEYQYVGEEGEILGGDEDDAELMHALAVSESVREIYQLEELTPAMWEDIHELVRRGEEGDDAAGPPKEYHLGDKAYRAFLSEFGMAHDLGDRA